MCIKVDKYSFLVYITNRAVVLTALPLDYQIMQEIKYKNLLNCTFRIILEKDRWENDSDLKNRFRKFLCRCIEDRLVQDGLVIIEPDSMDSFLEMSAKEHLNLYFNGKNHKLKKLLNHHDSVMECCSYSDDLKHAEQLFKDGIWNPIIDLRIIQNLFCSHNKKVKLLGESILKELIDCIYIWDSSLMFADAKSVLKLPDLFSWKIDDFNRLCCLKPVSGPGTGLEEARTSSGSS